MRISDWSSDVCSSDLATDFEDGRALIRAGEDDDGFAYDRVFSDLAPLSPNMKVFAAEVSFVRHGETYGMETLNVVARSDSEATKIAADISEESGHNDSRIAGRRRRLSVPPNRQEESRVGKEGVWKCGSR